MKEEEFAARVRGMGGRVFIVGGWVRDTLRGALPKDKDYVITGITEEDFQRMFPQGKRVGKSFPVYLLMLEGKSSEIAFARRERKTGPGYRGFAVDANAAISIEEDLYRRDTTMVKDKETKETLVKGIGEVHLEVLAEKIQRKFGVEAAVAEPRIAYRETIRKTVKAEGKHKKQSGGHAEGGGWRSQFHH